MHLSDLSTHEQVTFRTALQTMLVRRDTIERQARSLYLTERVKAGCFIGAVERYFKTQSVAEARNVIRRYEGWVKAGLAVPMTAEELGRAFEDAG